MNISMDVGKIQKKDILKVLDLLEQGFDNITSYETKLDNDYDAVGRPRIGLWMHNLKRAGLSPDDCEQTLHFLVRKINGFEGIKRIKVEKERERWQMKITEIFRRGYKNQKYEQLDPRLDVAPPLFELVVPVNFKEVCQRLRDEYGSAVENLKKEKQAASATARGALEYREDGEIYYKGTPLKMRPQIRRLCIFLMQGQNYQKPQDLSDIRDAICGPHKKVPNASVQKYVSELHILLKKCFKNRVVFRAESGDYFMDVDVNS